MGDGHAALLGLCAALLPPERGGPPAERLAADVERHLARLPLHVRVGLRAASEAVRAATIVVGRRPLSELAPPDRAAVLERIAVLAPATDHAVQTLKALVLLVHGTNVADQELTARAQRSPPVRDDPDLPVASASTWPTRSRADVVVVGSGAGGAMVARNLARAGADVIVVEEGRRFSVSEFREGRALARFRDLYRDGGATATLGSPPVLLPVGRGVGGTTLVNSGTCYRPPAAVLARWRRLGLALASDDVIGPHLDDVEATIGVAPVAAEVMGRNGDIALAGAGALGWQAGPLRRNAPGCGGCCQCAIGCPRNAKAGVHLNALPQACAAGARIVSDAWVRRVVVERGRAAGVEARRVDGSTFVIAAPVVVIAAGATETPGVLRRSGLGGHPRTGRNLAIHPAVGVAGRFEEPVLAWHGVLQSVGVEEFHEHEGILIEATSTPPGMGSTGLPGYGPRLLEELARAEHLATVGALVADPPAGSVRTIGRRTVLRYELQADTGRRLRRAIHLMGRLLLAAGAREVLTGVTGVPVVRDEPGLDAALATVDVRRLHLAAFHPTGTVAAGADPERFPADPVGALRGVDGVWIGDASLLPTSPTVNPQVTIMALAGAVAEAVIGRG